jgi:hypothetical protein
MPLTKTKTRKKKTKKIKIKKKMLIHSKQRRQENRRVPEDPKEGNKRSIQNTRPVHRLDFKFQKECHSWGDSRHGMMGWSVRPSVPCHTPYPLPVTLMAIIMTIQCIPPPPNACFAVGKYKALSASLLQTLP